MDAAATLEASGDLADALRQYERAKQLAPSSSAADEAIGRLRARTKREGDAAFRNARQFDALARTADAITWYERAIKILPDDDPNKKIAKDRLEQLRGRE